MVTLNTEVQRCQSGGGRAAWHTVATPETISLGVLELNMILSASSLSAKYPLFFNSTTELRPSHPPNGQPPNRYPSISSVCNGPGASYEQWEKSFPFAASFETGDESLPFSAVGHRRRCPKLPSYACPSG